MEFQTVMNWRTISIRPALRMLQALDSTGASQSKRFYRVIVESCCEQNRPVMYTLTDLGGGDNYSSASGINDLGQVVGTSGAFYSRAFLWTPETGMRDLGALPG